MLHTRWWQEKTRLPFLGKLVPPVEPLAGRLQVRGQRLPNLSSSVWCRNRGMLGFLGRAVCMRGPGPALGPLRLYRCGVSGLAWWGCRPLR